MDNMPEAHVSLSSEPESESYGASPRPSSSSNYNIQNLMKGHADTMPQKFLLKVAQFQGYPKNCCLYLGYVLLAGLICLASGGEEVTSLSYTCRVSVWIYPGCPHPLRGEGDGGWRKDCGR